MKPTASLPSLLIAFVLGVFLLSSCSRPYATYQTTSTVWPVTAVTLPVPAAAPMLAPITTVAETTPLEPALDRLDALVKNDNALANNKRLEKRLAHVRTLLAARPTAPTDAAQKMTVTQKLVMRKLNHRVHQQLTPTAMPSNQQAFRIGLVVGVVGLLLLLIGNSFIAALGGIALLVGIVLVVLSLLEVI